MAEFTVVEILKALNEESMNPSHLADNLNIDHIDIFLLHMKFDGLIKQDQSTKIVSITPSGQRRLRFWQ